MKKLNVIINSCEECPCCNYNSDFECYSCYHKDFNINSGYIKSSLIQEHGIILDGCPLEDVEGENNGL